MINPAALLEFITAFRGLEVDQEMEVLIGNKELKTDLFKVLIGFSYKLIDISKQQDYWMVRLKKLG